MAGGSWHDMGLGKTVTLIALHLLNQEAAATAEPTLVVCPATMLGAWEREIARSAPTVPVRRFHGPARTLDLLPADAVVLTTYATLRRSTDRLTGTSWSLVAADEAQAVKNHLSGTASALRKIPSRSRVALTGTPMENSLADLWALLDWATNGLLGTWSAFRERFARPIEAGRDTAAAARLAALISPLVLRRKKTDPGIAPEPCLADTAIVTSGGGGQMVHVDGAVELAVGTEQGHQCLRSATRSASRSSPSSVSPSCSARAG
ncbi:SNF2-related protein [Streptomyces sp. NPDC007088]|uniref:SNF2-related protein n=1 Tax=Streptomyces sp. NPDC007088 TaxID=3364773 RepID=UPI0036AFEB3E